jgi:hypothetical protein
MESSASAGRVAPAALDRRRRGRRRTRESQACTAKQPTARSKRAGRSLGLGYEPADKLEKGLDISGAALDAAISVSERTQ